MRYLFILILSSVIFLTACHLIEVNMVQRTVMDSGDGTSDTMKSVIEDQESDQLRLLVPIE